MRHIFAVLLAALAFAQPALAGWGNFTPAPPATAAKPATTPAVKPEPAKAEAAKAEPAKAESSAATDTPKTTGKSQKKQAKERPSKPEPADTKPTPSRGLSAEARLRANEYDSQLDAMLAERGIR